MSDRTGRDGSHEDSGNAARKTSARLSSANRSISRNFSSIQRTLFHITFAPNTPLGVVVRSYTAWRYSSLVPTPKATPNGPSSHVFHRSCWMRVDREEVLVGQPSDSSVREGSAQQRGAAPLVRAGSVAGKASTRHAECLIRCDLASVLATYCGMGGRKGGATVKTPRLVGRVVLRSRGRTSHVVVRCRWRRRRSSGAPSRIDAVPNAAAVSTAWTPAATAQMSASPMSRRSLRGAVCRHAERGSMMHQRVVEQEPRRPQLCLRARTPLALPRRPAMAGAVLAGVAAVPLRSRDRPRPARYRAQPVRGTRRERRTSEGERADRPTTTASNNPAMRSHDTTTSVATVS